MQFMITAKTTLTFTDEYIEQGLKKENITLDEVKETLKESFTEIIANEMSAPDGDFLGYSLSVDVTTNEKEESDV